MVETAFRIAILSDVHGVLPALEAVLADARARDVQRIVVAGDSTGGSHSRQVVERVRDLGAVVVRGNNEDYLLDYDRGAAPPDWYTASRWAPMRFVCEQFDAAGLGYLASLPYETVVALDGLAPIYVAHASPGTARQHLLPEGDRWRVQFREAGIYVPECMPLHEALARVAEPVLVCGHSHIQWFRHLDGRLALNPGSVGGPINADWRAQYAILEWQSDRWQVDLRAVPYDRAAAWADAHHSGFLEVGGAFARACLLNIEQGRNVPGYLVEHSIRVAQATGHTWDDMPEEVWARAVETFDWDAYPAVHEAQGHPSMRT